MLWAEHVAKNTAGTRDDVFEAVRHEFNDAELVELTGVCGLFAMSNRFQDSMRLPIEEQGDVDKIRKSVRVDPERLRTYLERMLEHWPQAFPAAPAGAARQSPAFTRDEIEAAARTPRVAPIDPDTATGSSARFLEAARALLGGVPNAWRIWAHTPHTAKFFLPFFIAFERDGAGSVLPSAIRLLALLKTHHAHHAPYLLAHHTVLARRAGLTEEQLAALASGEGSAPHFSPRERTAIAWAGHVAANTAKRNDALFDELAEYFTVAEVVELTALCAIAANADLFHNALRVPLEPAAQIRQLNGSVRIDPERLEGYIRKLIAD